LAEHVEDQTTFLETKLKPCLDAAQAGQGHVFFVDAAHFVFETMCELPRKIAALDLTGPITMVLDNARYQHNAAVKALPRQLGITLLFLPSYSPDLNLIERLEKFIKRRSFYGRYHPTFAGFQAAIQETLDGLPTTQVERLETLMTLNFQLFDDVSPMAA
jgi:hypothetical protein